MDFLPAAFDALASVSQFIVYKLTPSKTRHGKMDKLPVDYRNGHIANAHNSDIWLPSSLACEAAAHYGDDHGVGFVFTEADPFFFLDIDNCLEPCGTKWSPLALSLLSAFSGAAVEVSASGRGLHIIGKGVAPPHGCRNATHGLELYTSQRFVALTGTHASGSSSQDCTAMLGWLVNTYFPTVTPATRSPDVASSPEWTDTPCAGWLGSTDDDELIARALRSAPAASVFGDKIIFRDLWEANADALARQYPDATGQRAYDESAADAGLAQRLAFWTGNDCERIRRLMQLSALSRDKWERDDYLPRTILGVCGRQKEWLCDKPPQSTPNLAANQPATRGRARDVEGNTFLTPEQQKDFFGGCTYVANDHRILVPGGYLLNPERFNAVYGGCTFVMDKTNQRTSRKAFEAFTETQALRHERVNSSCFRPDLPPCEIVDGEGETSVNIYWPVQTPRQRGDSTRFLLHIAKLFPDENDQAIVLAYLAALVQHKGVKFQWCPLIQGVEGNGKTFLTRCVAYAIGSRYSHFPKAAEIAGKFNGWLYCKLFIGVEDIYLHDNRFEVMETLKPMVTNERQEIESKGMDKITRDICANFLINTNHKDGLIKTRSDRRFAPFYTAQQSLADLQRDGMLGDYFHDLYYWATKCGGYAIIADFLENYPIPHDLNPAGGCGRAPVTSSTESAIEHGRSAVESEILEAIEEGVQGFRGGWISSMQLDRLLIQINAARKFPINKRKELIESLGYIWHPGLVDGRVNNTVLPDNGKPRLYIRVGHPHAGLTGPSAISKAYADAQKNT